MNWVTGLLVYVIVWWLAFFMVLPWGVKVPDEPEPGHASSAPERPLLWRKALITTAIAALLWVAIYYVIDSGLLSLRRA